MALFSEKRTIFSLRERNEISEPVLFNIFPTPADSPGKIDTLMWSREYGLLGVRLFASSNNKIIDREQVDSAGQITTPYYDIRSDYASQILKAQTDLTGWINHVRAVAGGFEVSNDKFHFRTYFSPTLGQLIYISSPADNTTLTPRFSTTGFATPLSSNPILGIGRVLKFKRTPGGPDIDWPIASVEPNPNPLSVILSQSFIETFGPGEGDELTGSFVANKESPSTIIGVVPDVALGLLDGYGRRDELFGGQLSSVKTIKTIPTKAPLEVISGKAIFKEREPAPEELEGFWDLRDFGRFNLLEARQTAAKEFDVKLNRAINTTSINPVQKRQIGGSSPGSQVQALPQGMSFVVSWPYYGNGRGRGVLAGQRQDQVPDFFDLNPPFFRGIRNTEIGIRVPLPNFTDTFTTSVDFSLSQFDLIASRYFRNGKWPLVESVGDFYDKYWQARLAEGNTGPAQHVPQFWPWQDLPYGQTPRLPQTTLGKKVTLIQFQMVTWPRGLPLIKSVEFRGLSTGARIELYSACTDKIPKYSNFDIVEGVPATTWISTHVHVPGTRFSVLGQNPYPADVRTIAYVRPEIELIGFEIPEDEFDDFYRVTFNFIEGPSL